MHAASVSMQMLLSSKVCPCRSLPEDIYASRSREQPLISTRTGPVDQNLGESLDSLSLLERLLRCENESAHEHVASTLWEANNEQAALDALNRLATEHLSEWEAKSEPSNEEREGRIDENRG